MNEICLIWEGPHGVSWTNLGASATHTFDPESGVVIGGVLSMLTSPAEGTLVETPSEIKEQFVSGTFDLDWTAYWGLQLEKLSHYLSPVSEELIETMMLHEFGHFNGLSHNFAGSIRGNNRQASESIMDYFGPTNLRFPSIGDFDLQNLSVIYKHTSQNSRYLFCSDEDRNRGKLGCNAFDVGDPVDWYFLLASQTSDSLFNYYLQPLVELGKYLIPNAQATDSDRRRITKFLCQKTEILERIKAELKKNSNVVLNCQEPY